MDSSHAVTAAQAIKCFGDWKIIIIIILNVNGADSAAQRCAVSSAHRASVAAAVHCVSSGPLSSYPSRTGQATCSTGRGGRDTGWHEVFCSGRVSVSVQHPAVSPNVRQTRRSQPCRNTCGLSPTCQDGPTPVFALSALHVRFMAGKMSVGRFPRPDASGFFYQYHIIDDLYSFMYYLGMENVSVSSCSSTGTQ
jgi:hypothetical protein